MSLRRVEIEWLDSVSLAGWHDQRDVRTELLAHDTLVHTTVGLLLEETDDRYLVALSIGARDLAEVDSPMAIPRVAVRAIRDLVPAPA